jgi:hypothetical protein
VAGDDLQVEVAAPLSGSPISIKALQGRTEPPVATPPPATPALIAEPARYQAWR